MTTPVLSTAALIALLTTAFFPAIAQSLDGFWQSDAYGLVVQIDGAKMSMFQITSISCVPWWTAQRRNDERSTGETVFNRGDAEIRVTADSAKAMVMREGASISSMTLRRLSDRPKDCSETLPDTPLENYAVFWQTFAEHFAFFPLYRTDWDAVDRNIAREWLRPQRRKNCSRSCGR